MSARSPEEAAAEVDPENEDQAVQDEARVVHADSQSPRLERETVGGLLAYIEKILDDPHYVPSKWRVLIDQCLAANGITPGGRQQAVIFTEYADSAGWIADRLTADGYQARTYSGRQAYAERDEIRAAFMAGDFQVIVSTDAGNEGIDLQVAHVLVNFDIPWSLVRLEQRMGRIHRVGQTRDVQLYNLVATDTREGDTLLTLLENFVTAANELGGQMFDSLSMVAELAEVPYEEWLQALFGDDEPKKAEVLAAVQRVSAANLKGKAEAARSQEAELVCGDRRSGRAGHAASGIPGTAEPRRGGGLPAAAFRLGDTPRPAHRCRRRRAAPGLGHAAATDAGRRERGHDRNHRRRAPRQRCPRDPAGAGVTGIR